MAKTIPHRLEKIAKEQNTSVEKLVLDALEQADGIAYRAAHIIGVSPNTVTRWLELNNYIAIQQPVLWVKRKAES